MTARKITIIGGASAYVPGILYSLAHTGDVLRGAEVALMDVDSSRLSTMANLARRMTDEAGAGLGISSTTDLARALDGATFVLTNFRPGGLEGLRLDEAIPDKHGVLGQETTGPGGTFFALRSIPQVLRLCEAVEASCPEAWMVNYVNPTNFVADAIERRSKVRSIAICDGGGNGLKYSMPALLGVSQDDVRARAAGVNHHTWLLELRVGAEDGYPRLRELARQGGPALEGRRKKYYDFDRWALARYGVWPANDSYLYPYFNYEDALATHRAGNSLYQMFRADLPYHWPRFEAMADGRAPIEMDTSRHHTNVGHGDIALEIMLAIITNTAQEFHVNVANRGAITNLPDTAIVEVPALVDASGVQPLCMGDLPKGVLGLTQALINWEELSVDAALTGDRDLVVQAVMAHPWVRSVEAAERICEEMLAAHAAFLPQFV